jgi:hypothetical protein
MDEISPNETLTTAPPPPTEVKIRTMQSDVASMNASGGGLPKYQNVHISGLSAQKESDQAAVATIANRADSKNNLILIVIVAAILIILVVVGWFVYLKFRG